MIKLTINNSDPDGQMETREHRLLGKEGAGTTSERILQKLLEMDQKLQIVVWGDLKPQGETGVPLTGIVQKVQKEVPDFE